MHSHGLRQLVDDKSVASCQQTCCKLIVKTCYPQACCKLFQQVVTSLQMTSCNKPDFNRLVAMPTHCSYHLPITVELSIPVGAPIVDDVFFSSVLDLNFDMCTISTRD